MRIVSRATHYPGKRYGNEELSGILRPSLQEVVEVARNRDDSRSAVFFETFPTNGFLKNMGIEERSLLVDPRDPEGWWEENRGTYPLAREAVKVIHALRDESGVSLESGDKLVVVSNNYDTRVPGFATTVVSKLREADRSFPQVRHLNYFGEGCAGFVGGLEEADLYLRANPSAKVVVVSAEANSFGFHREKAFLDALVEGDTNLGKVKGHFVHKVLFGDGCVAALCVGDENDTYGEGILLDTYGSITNPHPDDLHLLEIVGSGTMNYDFPPRGVLFQAPPREFGPRVRTYLKSAQTVFDQKVLGERDLAFHTGSGLMLTNLMNMYGLSEEKMDASRAVLRDGGNMNSATTGFVLAEQLKRGKTNVAVVAFGAGFTLRMAYQSSAQSRG